MLPVLRIFSEYFYDHAEKLTRIQRNVIYLYMEIRLRENVYASDKLIPRGTIGIIRKNVVYFYDTTKTTTIGFDRDTCFINKELFSVNRNLSDREISVRQIQDAAKDLHELFRSKEDFEKFVEIINTL